MNRFREVVEPDLTDFDLMELLNKTWQIIFCQALLKSAKDRQVRLFWSGYQFTIAVFF
jgi:hypothetical protein